MRSSILLLVFLGLALAAELPGQSLSMSELERIAAIESPSVRETELRSHLQARETVDARLALLDEAEKISKLESVSRRISVELLLLSGRTEEAERLIADQDPDERDLAKRLSLAHGKTLLQDAPDDSTPIDRQSFQRLRDERESSPEYFASRRGAIVAAPLLFAPLETLPGEGSNQSDSAPSPGESSPSAGRLTIQVGAFSSRKNAEAHIAYLEDRGVRAVLVAPEGAGTIYRTVVSEIPAETAQRELIRLKEKGIEGFIIYPEN